MGTYRKKYCPNCKNVIKGWEHNDGTLRMGNPLLICSKCHTILVDNQMVEYVMFTPWLKFRFLFWREVASIFLSLIIGAIVSYLFFGENFNFIEVLIISIVPWIILYIRGKRTFENEKDESLKRTNNKEYLRNLCITGLISVEKYEKMLDYYNIKAKKEAKYMCSCGTEALYGALKCSKCKSNLTFDDIDSFDAEEEPEDEGFTCDNCGATVSENAEECPQCGCTFVESNKDLFDDIEEIDKDQHYNEKKLNLKKNNDSNKKKKQKSSVDQKYSDLNKLKKLLDKDIITKEEFEKEKKKILKD